MTTIPNAQGMFEAVWPVVDPTMPRAELLREAAEDLPNVIARHSAQVMGIPKFALKPGQGVAGSQGAALVVICRVPATKTEPRPITRGRSQHERLRPLW